MRLIVASMKHETNTFSPVPTPVSRFQQRSWYFGADVLRAYGRTRTGLGAYLELAHEAGAEIVTPVAAEAAPSGPVSAEAYAQITEAISAAVAAGCDGVMLDLHGAMVTETTEDGEGTLLARLRQIAPKVPICVNLDLHANITQAMVKNSTALLGYKTYPHVDSYDTARQVGHILLRAIRNEVNPVMAWGQVPLLAQTLKMGHEDEPMHTLLAMTTAAEEVALGELTEQVGMLGATVFGGFPLADVPDAGLSVVTVADGDRLEAEAVKDRLLAAVWERREEFVYKGEPLQQAVARAKTLCGGPVVLLDHADNAASGGTQDVMAVIAEVMRQGLENVAVASVKDPQAVEGMIRAGVGHEVTLDLGGKTDMPSMGRKGEPLRVTGRVRAITDGEFVITAPMNTGEKMRMGPTALLEVGSLQLVVTSFNHEPLDTGVFTSVGIDPRTKRYLVLKSRIHWRAGLGPLARHVIPCDGIGVCSSDNSLFTFKRVRRPIYPLDAMGD